MATPAPDRAQALKALASELSRLAAEAGSETELGHQVLRCLISATEALGGAYWQIQQRMGKEVRLALTASQAIEEAAGAEDSDQRQHVQKAAAEVSLSAQPLVLMPTSSSQRVATPGVLVNEGPHGILGVPVRSGDEVLASVQLWFSRQHDPRKLADLALVLQSLMTELGPRLRARHLRELGAHHQRQQQLLQMASDLAGQLDARQAGRLAVAHARELLGINRVSIAIRRGDRWEVLAVSGQAEVDVRSAPVTRMLQLLRSHTHEKEPWIIVRDEADELNEYFADTQMQSAVLMPIRDGAQGLFLGTLIGESTDASTFGSAGAVTGTKPPAIAMAQWLAELAGKALRAALTHESVPMGRFLSRIGHWRDDLTATQRRRWLTWTWGSVLALLIACFWPMNVKVEGDCTLLPKERALITTESAGRVQSIVVKEGQRVKKGEVIATLDTALLTAEFDIAQQTRRRLEAESDRLRGQGKEAQARIASLEAQAASETEKRLQLQIDRATLHAPMDGVLITPDIHLRLGSYLEAGEVLAEIASLHSWDLRLSMAEADMTDLEQALERTSPREVQYLLYTQSAKSLKAQLTSPDQILPALLSGKDGGLFQVTLQNVSIPPELQPLMRPGLTGRAKIQLERRASGYVLFRRFVRWLRMKWWI
jgi:Barrel-sandwich domain of CusB or HlyD membrane-fusion